MPTTPQIPALPGMTPLGLPATPRPSCAPGAAPKRTIAAALSTLTALVAKGVEYPEAEWQASQKHGVSADRLRAAYDEAQS